MYPVVAKVEYWEKECLKTTNILLYATSLGDATFQIEQDFKDMLESCCVRYIADDGYKFEIPDNIVEIFIKGEGNYNDGLPEEEK